MPGAGATLYDLSARLLDGRDVSMRSFAGKVLLIVNTATKFLINREGRVVGRFAPSTAPAQLDGKIRALLA